MKKLLLFTIGICLLLSGCSSGNGTTGNEKDRVSNFKDVKKEVERITLETDYFPKYYLRETNHLGVSRSEDVELYGIIDLKGNEILEPVYDKITQVKIDEKNCYIVNEEDKREIKDTKGNTFIKGEYDMVTTTGKGIFYTDYDESKQYYADSKGKIIREYDWKYNGMWNDMYLVRGGEFGGDVYCNYTTERVYVMYEKGSLSKTSYDGQIYDLDEKLLVDLNEETVPCEDASYYLIGENRLLEVPNQHTYDENKGTLRLLDFEFNEIEKIGGDMDYAYVSSSVSNAIGIDVKHTTDSDSETIKGTLTEKLKPGIYYLDLDTLGFLNDDPIVYDADFEKNNDLYHMVDIPNREKIIDDRLKSYTELDDGYFIVENIDGQFALIDNKGRFLENYTDSIRIEDYDLFFDDEEIDKHDDIIEVADDYLMFSTEGEEKLNKLHLYIIKY